MGHTPHQLELFSVPEGSEILYEFTGGLNATVTFTLGVFGIRNRQFYSREGSAVAVNGTKYVHRNDKWEKLGPSSDRS